MEGEGEQDRYGQGRSSDHGECARRIPDVHQQADQQCGQGCKAVVEHVNTHDPAAQVVGHDGLNKDAVGHPKSILTEAQPS